MEPSLEPSIDIKLFKIEARETSRLLEIIKHCEGIGCVAHIWVRGAGGFVGVIEEITGGIVMLVNGDGEKKHIRISAIDVVEEGQ